MPVDQLIAFFTTLFTAFVPVFVAMDPVGAVPLVVAWTSGMPVKDWQRQLRVAILTALVLGLFFIVGGKWLLAALGVQVPDFLIAGGLVLLVLAISDLVAGGGHEARGSVPRPDFGAVPIGTPLLAGPATLATLILLADSYGLLIASLALIINLLIAWRLFRRAGTIARVFGSNGLRATSKVASLLLAAIAIKFIREGVLTILHLPTI